MGKLVGMAKARSTATATAKPTDPCVMLEKAYRSVMLKKAYRSVMLKKAYRKWQSGNRKWKIENRKWKIENGNLETSIARRC